MDPLTLGILASQVVAILTPFFSKVGEAIATKFGEDAYEESKHLYEVVRDRFAKKDDGGRASKALQNFADDPQLYSNVLKETLLPLLQADPNFANTLSQIIKTGPLQEMNFGDESSIEDTHQTNEQEQGTQNMKGGKGVTFKNVSQDIGHKKEQK